MQDILVFVSRCSNSSQDVNTCLAFVDSTWLPITSNNPFNCSS